MEAPPSPKAIVYSLDSPSFSPRWSNPSPIPAVSLASIPVIPVVETEEKTAVMSEVKLSESNSKSNSNDSVEGKEETLETQTGTMDAQKTADLNENGGNGGNGGNGEEPKPELASEESEKSEKSENPVPPIVETVEPENHRMEIKLPASSSNTPEAGEDSELPAEEETEEAEESEEAEEELIPYDISLLHQILSFLIQLADPTK